jgi:hypothetical protein
MGLYINETSTGQELPAKGKYDILIADGGQPHDGKDFVENLVCVVDNGPFEAAGYAYSFAEFQAFRRFDGRPRKWLTHPQAQTLAK